jgi:hypothetical protein
MRPLPVSVSALLSAGLVLTVCSAGAAHAGGWRKQIVLERGCGKGRAADDCVARGALPRVAVNARGQSVVAWFDRNRYYRAATGDATGQFTRSVRLDAGYGSKPAVAISATGTAVVVYESSDRLLRFVRRAPGRQFTRRTLLVPRTRTEVKLEGAVAQPDGSTLVFYTSGSSSLPTSRLRWVRISTAGRPSRPTSFPAGELIPNGIGASGGGRVALCLASMVAVPGQADRTGVQYKAFAYTPAGGWTTLVPPLGPPVVTTENGPGDAIESVAPGRTGVVFGTVAILHAGDAGRSGQPGLLRADSRGLFSAPLAAPVARPGLAFGPVAGVDGSGRSVLVYMVKPAPAPFSREAPVFAVTGPPVGPFGAEQTLERGFAREPLLRPYRSGAIVAWEAPKHRWGIAIERNGQFTRARTPGSGPSSAGESGLVYNRDLATAGRYAALIWTARDGSVDASIGADL